MSDTNQLANTSDQIIDPATEQLQLAILSQLKEMNPVDIALGNVSGKSEVLKFGENSDIDSATPADIWDGGLPALSPIWLPPTQARIHNIASSLAADAGSVLSTGTATGGTTTTLIDSLATFISDGVTVGDIVINDTNKEHGIISSVDSETQITVENPMSDGGVIKSTSNAFGDTYRIATATSTGMAVTQVKGLDANHNEISEYVVNNGITSVPTVNAFIIIFRKIGRLFGVGGQNAGNITAIAQTDLTLTSQITAGNNQTLMAIYQVPADKIFVMTRYYSSINETKGSAGNASISLFTKPFGEGFQVKRRDGIISNGTSKDQNLLNYPLTIQQKTIIKVQANVGQNATSISAGFDGFLKNI